MGRLAGGDVRGRRITRLRLRRARWREGSGRRRRPAQRPVRPAGWGGGWRRDEGGQATVEAAFALPVLFLLALLLMQPGIILYDRMVMEAAAAEGCRLLATRSEAMGDADRLCEEYVLRRLGSVPSVDCFHVHGGGCTWRVEMSGDEKSDRVSVRVSTEVRPLPLMDGGAALLGLANERGNLVVTVERSLPVQPGWAEQAEAGRDPARWIGAWADESG